MKWKKLLAAVLALGLSAGVMTGCGSDKAASNGEKALVIGDTRQDGASALVGDQVGKCGRAYLEIHLAG